jgi:hypothetical protein
VLAQNDDVALVNACLEIEHELRQREFVAVECLIALAARSGGALVERLRELPLPKFAAAASCLYAAGWIVISPTQLS